MPYVDAMLLEVMRFSSFVAQGVAHAALSTSTLRDFIIPKVKENKHLS